VDFISNLLFQSVSGFGMRSERPGERARCPSPGQPSERIVDEDRKRCQGRTGPPAVSSAALERILEEKPRLLSLKVIGGEAYPDIHIKKEVS
jgi:hypothetical protein